MGSQRELIRLHEILVKLFDAEELRTLCFRLRIDYDDLKGEGKLGKARELVVFLERYGRIGELVATGKQFRPDVAWDVDTAAIPPPTSSPHPERLLPDDDIQHRLNLIKLCKRRLRDLEEKCAIQGYDTPPQIKLEIEDIQKRIDELTKQIEGYNQSEIVRETKQWCGQNTRSLPTLILLPSPFMVPPLPSQGVVGRDETLIRILDLLSLTDDQVVDLPPVALQGMGGIGKTTLAIAVSHFDAVSKLFPDGVLWVALGPNPTIRNLLARWGTALNIDLNPEPDENACCDRLRALLYHRRALLIIDDVWETWHSQYFTVAGPRCRTLLTTRESPIAYTLATRERTIRVDMLNPEASLALLRRLAPVAVIGNEQYAMRLCERLEFLPLALTLAGRLLANEADVPSRMQRLVSELIARRESRLQLLQTEGRLGLGEEPVSLQAILGMSVERLNSVDQKHFAMLAVFGGEPLTWEINAVAQVWECSVEEAEATISRFIQRGLVERRSDRYWMHALLADYAAEMLEAMGL